MQVGDPIVTDFCKFEQLKEVPQWQRHIFQSTAGEEIEIAELKSSTEPK